MQVQIVWMSFINKLSCYIWILVFWLSGLNHNYQWGQWKAYEIFMACLGSFHWKNLICTINIMYLWRKVVCLFCFVLFCFVPMRSTELGCFRLCSWALLKALQEEGCIGLVPWHLDFSSISSWILNDFFTEN